MCVFMCVLFGLVFFAPASGVIDEMRFCANVILCCLTFCPALLGLVIFIGIYRRRYLELFR